MLVLQLVDRIQNTSTVGIVLRRVLQEQFVVLDRLLRLALRRIDDAERQVIRGVLAVAPHRLGQHDLGLVVLLALREQEAELGQRLRTRRIETDRLLVRAERLVEALRLPEDLAVRVPEQRLVRRQLDRARERLLGLALLLLRVQQQAELEVRAAVARVELDRLVELLLRLVVLALQAECAAEQHERLRVIAAVVLDRLAILERGLVDLAELDQRVAEGDVIGRALRIEVDGLAQLVEPVVVLVEQHQRAALLLVRRRIVLVDVDHLLRTLERLAAVVGGEQRVGVDADAARVAHVRVVVRLRRLGRLRRAARAGQELDARGEALERLGLVVRLEILRVGVVGLAGGVRLARLLARRLLGRRLDGLVRVLDRLRRAAARGARQRRGDSEPDREAKHPRKVAKPSWSRLFWVGALRA